MASSVWRSPVPRFLLFLVVVGASVGVRLLVVPSPVSLLLLLLVASGCRSLPPLVPLVYLLQRRLPAAFPVPVPGLGRPLLLPSVLAFRA